LPRSPPTVSAGAARPPRQPFLMELEPAVTRRAMVGVAGGVDRSHREGVAAAGGDIGPERRGTGLVSAAVELALEAGAHLGSVEDEVGLRRGGVLRRLDVEDGLRRRRIGAAPLEFVGADVGAVTPRSIGDPARLGGPRFAALVGRCTEGFALVD